MTGPIDPASGGPLRPQSSAAPGPPGKVGSFAAELSRALGALATGDLASLTAAASAGEEGSLLAAQAAIYRHAERVELASKLVDYGVGGIKTILQTRV